MIHPHTFSMSLPCKCHVETVTWICNYSFNKMHARVQLPRRLRYSPFQVGKMLLHNVRLPNLLLITTLTLFTCLSSIVCIHKYPPQSHTRVYIYTDTLQSCWPCDSSSNGYRWLHFVQAYRADVAILLRLMSRS